MDSKFIARQAIIAALYAALCIALAPISYGAVQLRVAEMLMVLPFYNKKNIAGLTVGCFVANMYSLQLGYWDLIFGTLATLLACVLINKAGKLYLAAPIAALVNGIIIGAELYFVLGLPFWFSAATVALGEFAAVLLGVLAMKAIVRNEAVREMICGSADG